MTRAAPNFGHYHAHGAGVHIDGWGDGPLVIRHGGREWWFEFSLMFGPLMLRKRTGEPSDRQLTREDDPFWKPFTAWREGGSRCRAVWSKPGRTGKAPRRILYWVCHVPRGDTLAGVLSDLAQHQEPLGADFEQALEVNRERLYEP